MPGLMPHSRKLAEMGRGGDTEIGHLTEGEVVLPPEVAGQSDVRRQLLEAFSRAGIDIGRYTVGGEDDSINPRTGMREYRGRGAENEGDDRGFGGGGPGSGQGSGEGGDHGFGDGGDHHDAGAVSSGSASGGFSDGGDHHDAGAVSSGDASGPGPGGGGERGREGGMYGGGANQAGTSSASATGDDGGDDGGVTRDDVPSRASPGGGYHGPSGAIDSGYTLTGPDDTGYNPGTLGFWESQNPTRALISRGLAGLFPFMGAAYSMLDRNAPLRSPTPNRVGENDGSGGAWATASRFLPPTHGASGAASAAGPAGSQYTGFYTPPPDPNIPSWQRYLDVTS